MHREERSGKFGETFCNLFQDIETQYRFLSRFELECTVACSDSDRQGINSGTVYEFLYFIRMCIFGIFCRYIHVIFYTCQLSQLTFNYDTFRMRILYYFLSLRYSLQMNDENRRS